MRFLQQGTSDNRMQWTPNSGQSAELKVVSPLARKSDYGDTMTTQRGIQGEVGGGGLVGQPNVERTGIGVPRRRR